ncbi:hypothetical protein D9M73_265460 [compost metagenome]
MMLGHADVEGRGNQDVRCLLSLMGDNLGAHPVRPQQSGRPVLLVGTDRADDGTAALEKFCDFGPGR